MDDMMLSMTFDLDAFRREVLSDPLVQNVWENKYRWKSREGNSDISIRASQARVVEAVYRDDSNKEAEKDALLSIQSGYFLPAGRINAGAGTNRRVTLLNCYVGETIQDSMQGIQRAIMRAAFTLQQGGGIGHDFSTLRPAGAIVRRTGSVASGPIPYMDQMSAMSETVCSAGERRGAMMMTLADWHPDLWHEDQYETILDYNGDSKLKNPSFISVKRQKGRLTQTNISVLVSDAFMKAVKEDEDWELGHWVPRADGNHVRVTERAFPYDEVELNNDLKHTTPVGRLLKKKGEMHPFYIYTKVKARRIWDDLMQATYKYAEPGVLFIDRVNAFNNLNYCEDIQSTNPCGEQPLPPFGCCCLGSVNVAFMVSNPFTAHAAFRWDLFHKTVGIGIRFLDNVLDVAQYPLEEQRTESMTKRRIGLGLTGVADALLQLGLRYGSEEAVEFVRALAYQLREQSYLASARLAGERGCFPAFIREKFMLSPNVKALQDFTKEIIEKNGIRNGVLNTIAPNGTISLYSGNTGQGHEPVFAFGGYDRKVRQPNGELVDYHVLNYSERLYQTMYPERFKESELPYYFVGAEALTPSEHIAMHAACQEGIDASISKTFNCPTSMSFDEFKHVYVEAYEAGCKGCTTYRPDPDSGRGSVLSVATKETVEEVAQKLVDVTPDVLPRATILAGRTYKLKWPTTNDNWYITINHNEQGLPFEVFIVGSGEKAAESVEWVQATSRLLTAVLRRGGDVKFLMHELAAICSSSGGAFIADQHKYRPSIVAAIGGILEAEFRELGMFDDMQYANRVDMQADIRTVNVTVHSGKPGPDTCPECGSTPLVHEQGCIRCLNCDYTKCG